MDPAEIAALSALLKLLTDIDMDMYIEAQNRGYTPEQLVAMVESEEGKKKIQDAAWEQLKIDVGA